MPEPQKPRSALGQMAHAWIDIERTYRWLLAEARWWAEVRHSYTGAPGRPFPWEASSNA